MRCTHDDDATMMEKYVDILQPGTMNECTTDYRRVLLNDLYNSYLVQLKYK